MQPTFTRHDENVHLSYELPSRVYVAKVYPLAAQNGSSIILYGHNRGVTVAWRGGSPFKPQAASESPPKTSANGTGEASGDAIMIIDSDDDQPQGVSGEKSKTSAEYAFESEEEESDQSAPYQRFLDILTIDLDSNVTHLAVPPLSGQSSSWATDSSPAIFEDQIIIAVGCQDSSVRIITLPLNPIPDRVREARSAKHNGNDVKEIEVFKGSSREMPREVALTWTFSHGKDSKVDTAAELVAANERGSESQSRPKSNSARKNDIGWNLVLSWSAGDAHPQLYTALVPLVPEDDGLVVDYDSEYPVIRESLPAPPSALAFTPSRYPSPRHALLLAADPSGIVRIYDPLARTGSRLGPDAAQFLNSARGNWLAALYGPFDHSASTSPPSSTVPQRARILDAQWAFDGKCIVVLLADGQWGIWDLEGIGSTPPAAKSARLLRPTSPQTSSVLSGAGITPFSVRAYLATDNGDSSQQRAAASVGNGSARSGGGTRGTLQAAEKSLAPMTPSTRKTKQASLFTAASTRQATRSAGLSRGGLNISKGPAAEPGQLGVESVVFWYSTNVYAITNLMQYWQQAVSRATNSDPAHGGIQGPLVASLDAVSTGGEMITSTAQFDPPLQHRLNMHPAGATTLTHDILISAEHRFMILCPPKHHQPGLDNLRGLFEPAQVDAAHNPANRLDQDLLARGELDIGGVDRLLDGMAGSTADTATSARGNLVGNSARAPAARRVGFAADY